MTDEHKLCIVETLLYDAEDTAYRLEIERRAAVEKVLILTEMKHELTTNDQPGGIRQARLQPHARNFDPIRD